MIRSDKMTFPSTKRTYLGRLRGWEKENLIGELRDFGIEELRDLESIYEITIQMINKELKDCELKDLRYTLVLLFKFPNS